MIPMQLFNEMALQRSSFLVVNTCLVKVWRATVKVLKAKVLNCASIPNLGLNVNFKG